MSETGLVQILEGALMAAGEPLSMQRIMALFDELERPDKEDIEDALGEIKTRCEDRGFELVEVASGYRFQVRQNLATWVGRLWQERPQRYSRALLETLSLIAYRQPITRGEIEEIRGVAVSSNIIKTLQEREWVRVVGHRDVPGRPAMYATTKMFLDYFNLKSLEELPPLAEIKELDSLSGNLPLEDMPQGEENAAPSDPDSAEASESAGNVAASDDKPNPDLSALVAALAGGRDAAPASEAEEDDVYEPEPKPEVLVDEELEAEIAAEAASELDSNDVPDEGAQMNAGEAYSEEQDDGTTEEESPRS